MFQLKRHPVPIQAYFRRSLVLTFALPCRTLEPLLGPGLELDSFGDFGFVAIALVQTERLRPAGWPAFLGQNLFLSGYRIFARYTTQAGRHLRGLKILRSDTDKRLMMLGGNLFTHYAYRLAKVRMTEQPNSLELSIQTPRHEADLDLCADFNHAQLPSNSPFATLDEARHFAGPLPWTFDYERQTHSLILIKGVRKVWNPQPVGVQIRRCTFFERAPFCETEPILACAWQIADVPYRWERGRREKLA